MKNVLFISYHFPPLGGVAPRRVLRLLPHLPQWGWKPSVLTVDGHLPGELRDFSLLSKIPSEVRVYRAPIHPLGFAGRWLGDVTPPDRHLGWIPGALRTVDHIVTNQRIDAVVSVSAPYSAHLIGWRVKQKLRKPWIVDLRDEWSDNPVRQPVFGWQGKLDRWLESKVYAAADRILMTTPSYCKNLAARLPAADRHKVKLLTNGFDRGDFAAQARSRDADYFHLVYAGSMYGPQNPALFIKTFVQAVEKGRLPADRVRLTFMGRASRAVESEAFAPYATQRYLQRAPFASHEASIRMLQQADALLLLIGKGRGEGNIPGKTFEYLASGKPILALVPSSGDTAGLLREANAQRIVDPEDVAGIERALIDLYQRWATGTLTAEQDMQQVNRYESAALTEQFVQVLNEFFPKGSPPNPAPVPEAVVV